MDKAERSGIFGPPTFPASGSKRNAMLEIVGLIAKINVMGSQMLDTLTAVDAEELAALYLTLSGAFNRYATEIANEKGN